MFIKWVLKCFLISIFSTDLFASVRELPVGTFYSYSFSLEKNGVLIFSNKDIHFINPLYRSQKFQVIFMILLLPFICAIYLTQKL